MPVIKSKMIRVRDPETGFWHDLPATVSEESFRAAERAVAAEALAVSSAESAAGSASDAANSAESAAGSATTATTKAGLASGYAENAAGSASTATSQAEIASSAASDASGYASTASSAASTATTKAGLASDKADAAYASAQSAEGSADTAVSKAGEASDSATAAASSATAAEAWAAGTSGGTPSETNNAAYYAGQASGSATAAASSAGSAEAWATGGSSGTASATNNAKYYSEQAADSATAAATSASASESYAYGTNFAPAFSASTAYNAGAYVVKDGVLYRFTADHAAGAWTGSDAVAEKIAPVVADLKNALDDIAEVTVIPMTVTEDVSVETEWSYGYVNAGGREQGTASQDYSHTAKIPCAAGDVFVGSIRFVCVYNSNDNVVEAYGENDEVSSYTVPDNIVNIVLSCATGNKSTIKKRITHTEYKNINDDELAEIESTLSGKANQTSVDDLEISKVDNADFVELTRRMSRIASHNILDYTALTLGYYINKNGQISTNSSLSYSPPIPVTEGDVLTFWTRANTGTKIISSTNAVRYICAYDASGNAVSASGAENVYSYTVPEGITSIVLSVYGELRNNRGMVCINYTPPAFEEFGNYYTAKAEFLDGAFTDKTAQPKISKGYVTVTGDLSDGDALTIPATNIKKNKNLSFACKVTSFSKLYLGKHDQSYENSWIEINSEKIIVNNYSDVLSTREYTHGLTIAEYLYVSIVPADSTTQTVKIVMNTNGSIYTTEAVTMYMDGGSNYTAESSGSVLTDCVLTFSSGDLRKALWIFGDSYVGMGTSVRWPYYLVNDGYMDNVLLNGFPGENPTNAITALENMIAMGRPKTALWVQGMNGGSDTTTIDSTYMAKLKRFLDICSIYDIEPVLATIPTVPTRYHELRNAYVRSSGYRYVDFAKAVGANSSGEWYEGMLSSDGVHPTALGAQTLYQQLLLELPEVTMPS